MNFEIDLNKLNITELRNIVDLLERKAFTKKEKAVKEKAQKKAVRKSRRKRYEWYTETELRTVIKERLMGNSKSRIARLVKRTVRQINLLLWRIQNSPSAKIKKVLKDEGVTEEQLKSL